MARRYKVEGTSDFLIAAVLLAGLGIWSIKDGWFPSPKVLEKHPREVAVVSPVDGVIVDLPAVPGTSLSTNQIVARVRPSGDADPIDLRSGRLGEATDGTVMEVRPKRLDTVTAGETIALISPDEHFYPFNRSLAILSLIGAVVCAVIHRAVK